MTAQNCNVDATTTWNIPPGDNGPYSSMVSGNGVTVSVVNDPLTTFKFETNETFTNLNPAWFNHPVAGGPSLRFEFQWDQSPELPQNSDIDGAGDDKGTAMLTIAFDEPVNNPVLHIDRLGGAGRIGSDPNNATTNSSIWTLTSGGTLTKIAGTDDLEVVGNTFFKTPDVQGTTGLGEATQVASTGTAAGSIGIDTGGPVSSITFSLTGRGVEGTGGDAVEIAICSQQDLCEAMIGLEKVGDGSALQNPTQVGDIITYAFEVCNTGNLDLTNISVSDPLVIVSGGPLASLAVGDCDQTTFTGSYMVTADDIANEEVENTATTTGFDPEGNPVMDTSDDPQDPTNIDDNGDGEPDDPTVVELTVAGEAPVIELTKTGDGSALGTPTLVGDIITYTFEVCNTGNVDLTNITVSDPLVIISGGPLASLAVDQCNSTTFTGSYAVTAGDIATEEVENTATTSGFSPTGTQVMDTSDDPQDPTNIDPNGDGEPDDPTVVPLNPEAEAPMIGLEKTGNGSGLSNPSVVGDIITYTFEVCNTGNVDLTNITVSDPLVLVSGGPIATLAVGACNATTFTGSYAITAGDIANEAVENTATTTGISPEGAQVMDTSDDPQDPTNIDPNGDGEPDDPTVVPLNGADLSCTLASFTDPSCFEGIDGEFTVVASGGSGPYTYTINPGGDSNSTGIFTGLEAGVYTVTITDNTGEIAICSSVTLADPPAIECSLDNIVDVTTVGGSDGSFTISGSGGSGVYFFAQTGSGTTAIGASSFTASNLSAGSYSITIIDENGCAETCDPVVIGEPGCMADAGTLSPVDATCLEVGEVVELMALPLGNAIVPMGYEVIYVLTSGPNFVLEAVNTSPLFDVDSEGTYTIHTLVAENSDLASPDYLDLSGVVFGTTTAADVLTIIGTSGICADLDAAGAPFTVEACEECDELVCNGSLQISLGEECTLEVTPDMLLEAPVSSDEYIVLFYDADGNPIGNTLTAAQAGMTIDYKVLCGGNSCWGSVIVEANIVPEITAPCACGEEPGDIPAECVLWCGSEDAIPAIIVTPEEAAALFGQCGPELIGNIVVEETSFGDLCSSEGEIVTITYMGKVIRHGRVEEIEILCQSYSIQKLDISGTEEEFNMNFGFPNDVVLDCGTGSTPQDIYVETMDVTNAFPYYIDMHNLVTDTTFVFDTIQIVDESTQIDRDTMVQQDINGDGIFEWVLVTVVDKGFIDTVTIDTVLGELVNPAVPIKDQVCNLLVSYSDLEFEACGDGTKILREWTMVDWCNDEITRSSRQTIEIIDLFAPIVLDEQDGELVPVTMLDDLMVSIEPWTCQAKLRLPQLTIQDNCAADPTVEWISLEGRIDEGFILDLWKDQGPIEVIGSVVDNCGNTTEVTFNIIVTDLVAPVPIAETSIQVSLTTGAEGESAIAKVYAETFDEGSHDAGCGPVSISVVRLDDWSVPLLDCNGDVVGYRPMSCDPHVTAVDLGVSGFKESDCEFNGTNVQYTSAPGDFVKFCCADVGEDIMVVMIVTDEAGNTNQATVRVKVVDKLIPTLVCDNAEIACGDDLEHVSGPRIVGGVCSAEDYNIQLVEEVDRSSACGAGEITREFFVDLDGDGVLSPGDLYCEQIITITDETSRFNPYTIKWPKHYDDRSGLGVNLECNPTTGEVVETAKTVDMGASFACVADDDSGPKPVWCDTECGLLGYSMEVDTIDSFEACLKIVRRWTVIDWCVWESNGSNVDDENDTDADQFEAVEDWAQGVCADCDNGYGPVLDDSVYFRYTDVDEDGYYTYDQVIKVFDDTAPEIDAPESIVVSISGGADSKDGEQDCEGSTIVDATATDLCGGNITSSQLIWNVRVQDIFGNPVRDFTGSFTKDEVGNAVSMSTRDGGIGDTYIITWRVQDGCGNTSSATTRVTFVDNTAPTPFCISGLTTAFAQDDGMVTVWANEFDFGSFDNCCPHDQLRWSIVPSGDTPIRPNEFGFGSQSSITFDCRNLANFSQLDIWVWDCDGNGDFCTVGILLGGDCPHDEEEGGEGEGSGGMISGNVQTRLGDMISETLVSVTTTLPEYPYTMMTASDGDYSFPNNPLQYNYQVEAAKDDEYINGVSTLDMVLIQRHILAVDLLNDPYKAIAADANNDSRISASDLIELRKLVLGIVTELPNNESWRFIDASETYSNDNEPWPFTESLSLINLQNDMIDEDYIGVKIGDVTGDAKANELMQVSNRSNGTLMFGVENANVNVNDIVTIDVTSTNFNEIFGYQFTLNHAGLEFLGVQSGVIELDEYNIGVREEVLTMSWNTPESLTVSNARLGAQEVLFSLQFKANSVLTLENSLSVGSSITAAEAYTGESMEKLSIGLEFTNENVITEVALYQNEPNPFAETTSIGFELPQKASVSISIMDLTGKVIHEINGIYDAGLNQVVISKNDINTSGIVYYQLESGNFSATRKMIIIE